MSPTGTYYPIPYGKTYLSIPDSKKDLTIDVAKHSSTTDFGMFTNRKLYVGRNINVSTDSEAIDYMDFPWKMNTYDVSEEKWTGLESVEFGPQVTEYPHINTYYPDRDGGYYSASVTFPFVVKRGALVRISSAMIRKPTYYDRNHKDVVKRDFLFESRHETKNPLRVNYVISESCCLLSGYELGYVQSYIKVEATNPPGVSSDFIDDTYENKLLIVPAGCKEIYAAHEKWGKFRHILEESEPRAIESEETSKPEIDMGTSAGILHIENEAALNYGVEVFTADGQLVYRGNESTISVPRGVLIVRCGNTVRKIIN